MRSMRKFLRDRRGVTAVEYGLIVAVLSLAIVGGVEQAGDALVAMFGAHENTITDAVQ